MKILYHFCLGVALLLAWNGEAIEPDSVEIECTYRPVRRPPRVRVDLLSSSNWSGYVAVNNFNSPKTGSVTFVEGSWVIPMLHATLDSSYSSAWVGIDGAFSDSVEQIGTEHEFIDGQPNYYAWFEFYPSPEFEIVGFPVNPGDKIRGSVTYIGQDTFKMVIENLTRKVHHSIPTRMTHAPNVSRNSAEWIMEAPYSGGILPLADFGTITFTACTATINGKTAPIQNTHWKHDSIEMTYGPSGPVKAIPSSLFNKGANFRVTWENE